MNAFQPLKPDGTTMDVWCCGNPDCTQNSFFMYREGAEACCVEKVCDDCGGQRARLDTRCAACGKKLRDKELESAPLADNPDPEAMLFYQDIQDCTTEFFRDADDLLDYCALYRCDPPRFAWLCIPNVVMFDPDKLMEDAIQSIGWDTYDSGEPFWVGEDEFREACRKFTEQNSHLRTWYPGTQKVAVNPVAVAL